MSSLADLRGLLIACIENPNDLNLRLVYADCLGECGRRAEEAMIREYLSGIPDHDLTCEACREGGSMSGCPSCHVRGGRAVCLLHGPEFVGPSFREAVADLMPDPPWHIGDWTIDLNSRPPVEERYQHNARIVNGMIEEIRCSLATWERAGPEICHRHPIKFVSLHSNQPYENRGVSVPNKPDGRSWFWCLQSNYDYGTREERK